MLQTITDITKHNVVEHEALGRASFHIFALQDFGDQVVYPSIAAISEKLECFSKSSDDIALFMLDDLEALREHAVQGFMIAVQSMWERGLRAMLCTCESKLFNGASLSAIKNARWNEDKGGVRDHFHRLIGIEMSSLTSYDDLNFLSLLANVIRHGDGHSAKRLFELCPSLWPNALDYAPVRFSSEIKIPTNALQQMIKSVIWFWEDIENIRCNSFQRKSPATETKLSNWRSAIDQRNSERVWARM